MISPRGNAKRKKLESPLGVGESRGGGGSPPVNDEEAELELENPEPCETTPAVAGDPQGATESGELEDAEPIHIGKLVGEFLAHVSEGREASATSSSPDLGTTSRRASSPATSASDEQLEKEAAELEPPRRRSRPKARNKTERMESALPEIMDVEKVAEALGVSKRLVLRYLRSGELSGRKVGREWRILKGALTAFVGSKTQPDWLKKAHAEGRASIEKKERR